MGPLTDCMLLYPIYEPHLMRGILMDGWIHHDGPGAG